MADLENNEKKESKAAPFIAFLILFTSALISVWLAYVANLGVMWAWIGLIFNTVFGVMYGWSRKSWVKRWLIARYVVSLFYGLWLGFFTSNLIGALFELIVAICMFCLLCGIPSARRAFAVATSYFVLVCALAGLVLAVAQQRSELKKEVLSAQAPTSVESRYRYHLSFEKLAWRPLSASQAEHLLGVDVQDADLKLVRNDGSSFGMIFPLQFQNIKFTPALALKLEEEIKQVWLDDLVDWQRSKETDGFMLTAHGKVDGTAVAYVIFYKHFGNLGLYGVFWSDKKNEERLRLEAGQFYDSLTAAPLKERLDKSSPAKIFEDNSNAVVQITVFDEEQKSLRKASGFNLAPSGLIVTNLHVITSGHSLEVKFPDRKEAFKEVQVAAVSRPEADLVLLALHGEKLPTIKALKSLPIAAGDVIYLVSNPKGQVNSLSEGVVSEIRKEGGTTLYQISMAVAASSSGGPVFNQFGEVVGVANSIIVDAHNLNFSTSIEQLEQLFVFDRPISLSQLIETLNTSTSHAKTGT